ncbi:cytochrome c biogenesis protein ResB [Virgibacillus sp. MSJ-26]|uniref:cytochrome c biogenesis protein ResB n=1 Tax=Virgibacillus sp. MSJ-26 TaxID=2841522 RepID=UPI001C113935|nr:cytochrome c biogenesis protein ResB [Virgibacillus sp. MSJ-26]MBU5467098.1 cytochrome c biogenesis protein ResB [Virgibacillus sp. MSJ-26]
MDKLKCECGHMNLEGTILCESCGKPIEGNQHLDGNDKTKLLNMRYDGSARRSKTYSRTLVDKTWNLFSSVKVGVIFIIIALLASGIGTIFPQEMYIPEEAENRDPAVFYEEWYGLAGKIYYQLGFHELYSSWWYLILIALIGVSLVICSIDRFVPLYRALKLQQPKRHNTFLSRQRLFSKTEVVTEDEKKTLIHRLKKSNYKIMNKSGNVLAEKNRFSRWGPYVNHIGLIIILIAAILRLTPFFYLDDYVWVREGEQKVIPGTNNEYYIENKRFLLETYDEDDERFSAAMEKSGELVHKNYQSDVVIYKAKPRDVVGKEPELEKVVEGSIQLNEPLKFDNYTLYQAGYQENELANMTFQLYEKDDPKEQSLEDVTIDLNSPDPLYELDNGFELRVSEYFPDYEMEDGEPRTDSKIPRNPAFIFNLFPPDSDEGELSLVGAEMNFDPTGENKYMLGIADLETRHVSGISIRRDYTIPLFIIGATIFMIGVMQGMYWQHRRIWVNPEGNGIVLAAHTNKNWTGLKKDINKAIAGSNIQMVVDQEEMEIEKKVSRRTNT